MNIKYEEDKKIGYDTTRADKPILEICTLCPIMMVGLNKYRIIHKPCPMHSKMQNFFDNGGEAWI